MSVQWNTMTNEQKVAHCHAVVMLDGPAGKPTWCELDNHRVETPHRNRERKVAWYNDMMFNPLFQDVPDDWGRES